MTRIEDLLRQSLTEGPLPVSNYPGVALEQRVRRARRRAALGAMLAVAAVVAAVAVPLATLGGQSTQRVVSPTVHSASPRPSRSTLLAPSGVNAGVNWVAAAHGEIPWALVSVTSSHCPGCTNPVLSRVGASGVEGARYPVKFPGVVVATANLVWVVGGIEDRTWVSVLDIATGSVATRVFADEHLSAGAVDGDDLYVANDGTWQVVRLSLVGNKIVVRGSISLHRNGSIGDIVTTPDHHIWVNDASRLVELSPTATGLRIVGSVEWGGGRMWGPVVYGPGNPSPRAPSLWAWDGRTIRRSPTAWHYQLIDLIPSYLHQGTSVAEGYRVTLTGVPTYALSTPSGGVFVGVSGSTAPTLIGQLGVYYFSPQALRQGTSTPTAHIDTPQVTSMALDPAGGVDVTVGSWNSKLVRWDPTGS